MSLLCRCVAAVSVVGLDSVLSSWHTVSVLFRNLVTKAFVFCGNRFGSSYCWVTRSHFLVLLVLLMLLSHFACTFHVFTCSYMFIYAHLCMSRFPDIAVYMFIYAHLCISQATRVPVVMGRVNYSHPLSSIHALYSLAHFHCHCRGELIGRWSMSLHSNTYMDILIHTCKSISLHSNSLIQV